MKDLTVLMLFVLVVACAPAADSRDHHPAEGGDARGDLARERTAQRQTVADIRLTGTAMFSWLTDQIGAGAAGQPQTERPARSADLTTYPRISQAELVKLLVPKYLTSVLPERRAPPGQGGHGHPEPGARWRLLGHELQ